jgi:hypothetical protein
MLFSKPIKGEIRDLNFPLFDVIHVHISNICGPHRYYTSLSMHRLNGQVNVTNLDQVGMILNVKLHMFIFRMIWKRYLAKCFIFIARQLL